MRRLPRRPPGVRPEPEEQFQQAIIDLARTLGYRAYHTHDSRKSEPGFPDLVLARAADNRLIYAEVKTETGRTTPDQEWWLQFLAARGEETYLWRPSMKEQIVNLLAHRDPRVQHARAVRNQEAAP